ncbi:hypothetical protein B7L70_00525 [Vulcanisaeta sp. EB80]|nr:hypothetical protein B7L70_00525 [Vulcanisaeta sp. EB80]
MGVGKRPKPTWIIPLVIALAITLAIVSVLLLTHVTNKPGTPASSDSPINMYPGPPIYVVGPQSLTQRLVSVGVPQSLIKPVSLGQLSSLPGNSTVIIDYSVIEPSVVVGVVNGEMKLNLTSPVIDLLTSLIAKGDLVMLYGNSSDLPVMEYLLAYSWARRYGVLYMMSSSVPFDYLIAYPIIPIGSKKALAVAFGGPHYLVIGPVIPSELAEAVAMYESLSYSFSIASLFSSLPDPEAYYLDLCYYIYEWYHSVDYYLNGKWDSDSYFIWAFPILGPHSYEPPSIMGYSDGNGTLYYDTCLEISTQVWVTATPPNIPAYVYGYVGYRLSETAANNGGEVLSETGTIDYYTSYRYYNESITNSFVGGSTGRPQLVHLTTGYGFSESISISTIPGTTAYGYPANNVTWRFRFSHANNPDIDYYNDFDDSSPLWIMPNFIGFPNPQQSAYLPVYVSTKVLVSSRCYLVYTVNTYEYIWVDGGWWLTAQPTSSSTGLVPSVSYGYGQPGTYVSGVKSWKTSTPELCWP